MKFGIKLAIASDGSRVSSGTCSKDDGPFTCVMCEEPLTLRAGAKTPKHFIHKTKSDCVGNNDEHREESERIDSGEPVNQEPEIYQDPEVPLVGSDDLDIPNEIEISENIIDDALSFIENDILKEEILNSETLKEAKCTDCKKIGLGFYKMFTNDDIERFSLNDLYVCPTCVSFCPVCNGPNSTKRAKRVSMCFSCDFKKNEWMESSSEAVDKMGPIPEPPSWLGKERDEMVLKMFSRRSSARTVYGFMFKNRSRITEYRDKISTQAKTNAIKKALRKERKDSIKTRERNQKARERMMGAEATARYKKMYDNKSETCGECGSQGKRRNMTQYSSVLGSYKYSCKNCITQCPSCNEPSVNHDLGRFHGKCFECFSWGSLRENTLKTDKKTLIDGCLKRKQWAWGTLYVYGPFVKKGKYSGDRLVHVPSSEMDSVVRRDQPENRELGNLIVTCRKM